MLPQNFPALMELDKTVNRYLYNKESALREDIQGAIQHSFDIPDYLDIFDVRKPVDQYVDEKLDAILRQIFNRRKEVEKTLSRSELVAYDQIIAKMLDPPVLMDKLKHELRKDEHGLIQMGQMANQRKLVQETDYHQAFKHPNTQPKVLDETKNFD